MSRSLREVTPMRERFQTRASFQNQNLWTVVVPRSPKGGTLDTMPSTQWSFPEETHGCLLEGRYTKETQRHLNLLSG